MKFPLVMALVVASGCSKQEPAPPEPTEPWLNVPAPSAAPRDVVAARFAVEPRAEARVSLPGKEATPRGTLRVARGELSTNLLDLTETTGTVAFDVASIAMEAERDQDAKELTRTARNWLSVGDSRPEAERERLRWAEFRITSIEDSSATNLFDVRAKPYAPPTADGGQDAQAEAGPPLGESRRVRLTAIGQLTLHSVRTEKKVSLEVTFFWNEAPEGREPPHAAQVTTRRPLSVTLAAHEILPRNAQGVVTAAEKKLLGVQVGREAQVDATFDLRARRR